MNSLNIWFRQKDLESFSKEDKQIDAIFGEKHSRKQILKLTKKEELTTKQIEKLIKFAGNYYYEVLHPIEKKEFNPEAINLINYIIKALDDKAQGDLNYMLTEISLNSDDPKVWEAVSYIVDPEGPNSDIFEMSAGRKRRRDLIENNGQIGKGSVTLNSINPFAIGLVAWAGWEVLKNNFMVIVGIAVVGGLMYLAYKQNKDKNISKEKKQSIIAKLFGMRGKIKSLIGKVGIIGLLAGLSLSICNIFINPDILVKFMPILTEAVFLVVGMGLISYFMYKIGNKDEAKKSTRNKIISSVSFAGLSLLLIASASILFHSGNIFFVCNTIFYFCRDTILFKRVICICWFVCIR